MLLLQEENAAKSEKDGRYNDALDHKRERNNGPQPTCVGCVFNLDKIFSWIEKAQDSAVPLPILCRRQALVFENYQRSMMFLNRGNEQVRFQFVSRAADFKDLQAAFQGSHFTWRNL
jgi:hypothetical protein